MVKQYRKKPIVVEAIQFTGNFNEVVDFMGGDVRIGNTKEFGPCVVIHTLEGDMTALYGDYIIKGVQGEFYPCKPEIFEETHEEVN